MKRTTYTRLAKALMGTHAALYKLSGGRVDHLLGIRFLFLTTTGRKSGEPRRVPLLYVPDGDDYLVVASNFGNDFQPAWWGNLQAAPEATVEVRAGLTMRVRAEEITDSAKYEEYWVRFVHSFRFYERYRKRTDRHLPIVRLHRSGPEG